MKVLKIIGIVVICIVLIIVILFNSFIVVYYEDNAAPSSSSLIIVNKITKHISVKEHHSCSYVDCKPSDDKYSKKLNKEEYKQVKEIMKKYKNDNRYKSLYLGMLAQGVKIDLDEDDVDTTDDNENVDLQENKEVQ